MNGETIAITGSGGFIGKALTQYLLAQGKSVTAMQRRKPVITHEKLRWHKYELGEAFEENFPQDVTAIVHAAVSVYTPKNKRADELNTKGTQQLLDWCRKHKAHFVFLSTQSAHEEALSHYGRNKLHNERLCDLSQDLVLRLGLVLGHEGLFARVAEMVKKAKFIPLPDGGKQPVQTIHIDDLCRAIDRCLAQRRAGRYYLAHPEVLSVRKLYETVAQKFGAQPRFVSLPTWMLMPAVRTAELLGLNLPAGSENLLGLKASRAAETQGDIDKLGVQLRDFRQSISEL